MATEKRLIDANAVKELLDNLHKKTFALEDPKTAGIIAGTIIACKILIDEIPTVDAVEVVRCVACLYRSQYSDENGMYHCGGIETTKDHVLPVVSPDFSCAYGEKRIHENC